jgi:glycerol-3-phosphate dehydrogenase
MAYIVEDVLARRMRILFIDTKAAIKMCPSVARLMAQGMQKNPDRIEQQILEFTQIASECLLKPFHKKEEVIII